MQHGRDRQYKIAEGAVDRRIPPDTQGTRSFCFSFFLSFFPQAIVSNGKKIPNPREKKKTMAKPSLTIVYDPAFQTLVDTKAFDDAFLGTELPKLQQAAEVHGYRGASKKKHNGIVPIRPTDKGLLKTLARLVASININIDDAFPVKAVAHVPSGNRLVGYMFPTQQKVIFFGVANYDD